MILLYKMTIYDITLKSYKKIEYLRYLGKPFSLISISSIKRV